MITDHLISDRILFKDYETRITTADKAALLIKNQAVVGASGFTKAGDSKSVLPAFAKRAETEDVAITLITGASLGYTTDADLAENNALLRRMPFMADPALRKSINDYKIKYIDQHLSETVEQLICGHIAPVDIAIIEASSIDEKGNIIPTTSIGNSVFFAKQAKQIHKRGNYKIPVRFKGIQGLFVPKSYPKRGYIGNQYFNGCIGKPFIEKSPGKRIAVGFTYFTDQPALVAEP